MKLISNDIFFAWIEREVAEGRCVRFLLKGNSMFPLLRDGLDQIILYPCTPDELKLMDVVLFRYKGGHLLHRIIKKDGDRLIMQGDGAFISKEECLAVDVVGKVHAVIRPSGKVLSVNSRKWRLSSALWRGTGPLRVPILKILVYFKDRQ